MVEVVSVCANTSVPIFILSNSTKIIIRNSVTISIYEHELQRAENVVAVSKGIVADLLKTLYTYGITHCSYLSYFDQTASSALPLETFFTSIPASHLKLLTISISYELSGTRL